MYPSRKIREKLGLKSGQRVRFHVEGDRLMVERAPSVEELLEEEPLAKITFEEHLRETRSPHVCSSADSNTVCLLFDMTYKIPNRPFSMNQKSTLA
ncbi:MAG TPA: AbrB/MazE/SpoVT family DNA-binding domain-containing protein [bacterium]|nr:AbrB/MazE/SpoVT family DNA-binding domain-containing protein [bacterium]